MLGREVFVPVALAILFSFVLAPLGKLLRTIRLPRSIAVISVVVCPFAIVSGLAMAMVGRRRNGPGTYRSIRARCERRSLRPTPQPVKKGGASVKLMLGGPCRLFKDPVHDTCR